MNYSELRRKEVVNMRNCKKLGHVTDLDFDPCTGCICSIKVSHCFPFFPFFQLEEDLVIPFQKIRQIGPDIIIVETC